MSPRTAALLESARSADGRHALLMALRLSRRRDVPAVTDAMAADVVRLCDVYRGSHGSVRWPGGCPLPLRTGRELEKAGLVRRQHFEKLLWLPTRAAREWVEWLTISLQRERKPA